jgi:hypothetical protein
MKRIAACLLVLAVAGCSPKIIEKVRTEYITETVHHRDTTYSRDSVYIREWMKGDTVFVDRFRDRYIYRDRWRDSVRVEEKHDTTTVQVKVDKPLSFVQKAKIRAFWPLFGAVLACLAFIFRKPLLLFLKSLLKL